MGKKRAELASSCSKFLWLTCSSHLHVRTQRSFFAGNQSNSDSSSVNSNKAGNHPFDTSRPTRLRRTSAALHRTRNGAWPAVWSTSTTQGQTVTGACPTLLNLCCWLDSESSPSWPRSASYPPNVFRKNIVRSLTYICLTVSLESTNLSIPEGEKLVCLPHIFPLSCNRSIICLALPMRRTTVQYCACLTLEPTASSLPSSFHPKHQACKVLPELHKPGLLAQGLQVGLIKESLCMIVIVYEDAQRAGVPCLNAALRSCLWTAEGSKQWEVHSTVGGVSGGGSSSSSSQWEMFQVGGTRTASAAISPVPSSLAWQRVLK